MIPFDFHKNGNAYRRDPDAQPRHLLVGIDPNNGDLMFHTAGDEHIEPIPVIHAIFKDFLRDCDPVDAFTVGREFGRAEGAADD